MSHQTKLRKQLKPLFRKPSDHRLSRGYQIQWLSDQRSSAGSQIQFWSIGDLSHLKILKTIGNLTPMDQLKDTCKFNNGEDVQ